MNANVGFKYSVILHVLVILASIVYVSGTNNTPSTENIIDIDLINIKPGAITNLKNSPIVTKSKETKKEVYVAPSKVKQPTTIDKPKPKAESKSAVVAPSPKAKKKNDAAQSKANKEADRILDSLENAVPNEDFTNSSSQNKTGKLNLATTDKPYDRSLPMTIAEQDNIKMQIERKFSNPIVSDFQSGDVIIKIKLDMRVTGEIEKITVLNSSSYTSKHSDAFAALKDSLIRAAHMASPLKGLDESRYEGQNGWKEIELSFDAYYLMH
jgi:hypothetical protein